MQFQKAAKKLDLNYHIVKWSPCTKCRLASSTKVLWRGYCPAKICFIGEAPGRYEHIYGYPFIGVAGYKLQEIIDTFQGEVTASGGHFVPYLLTNVVACIPLSSSETREPAQDEIVSCSPRLLEILKLSEARVFIAVGEVARKTLERTTFYTDTILHPSALLRMDKSAQTPAYLKIVSQLFNAIVDAYGPCETW